MWFVEFIYIILDDSDLNLIVSYIFWEKLLNICEGIINSKSKRTINLFKANIKKKNKNKSSIKY